MFRDSWCDIRENFTTLQVVFIVVQLRKNKNPNYFYFKDVNLVIERINAIFCKDDTNTAIFFRTSPILAFARSPTWSMLNLGTQCIGAKYEQLRYMKNFVITNDFKQMLYRQPQFVVNLFKPLSYRLIYFAKTGNRSEL